VQRLSQPETKMSLRPILLELTSALQEHGKRLKGTAVFKLVKQDDVFEERRSA
jgi:hypothetical protein